MRLETFSKSVLLTGAGLTKNWGGKLASEVWDDLVGHPAVRSDAGAKQALLSQTQFEVALAQARSGQFGPTAYTALATAVYEAFVSMDRQIACATTKGGNVHSFQRFLQSFGRNRLTSFAFTLNQDLLIERKFYNHDPYCGIPSHPGVTNRPRAFQGSNRSWFGPHEDSWPSGELGQRPYSDLDVTLPSGQVDIKWADLAERFNYVKLHGAFNWREPDGSLAMVMGSEKEAQIGGSRLFAGYSELFQSVLKSGKVRLMSLGYGFSDAHINAVIAEAAVHHRLELFVWDTRSADATRSHLLSQDGGESIWNALCGYERNRMADMFPADGSTTELWRSLQKRYFGQP